MRGPYGFSMTAGKLGNVRVVSLLKRGHKTFVNGYDLLEGQNILRVCILARGNVASWPLQKTVRRKYRGRL